MQAKPRSKRKAPEVERSIGESKQIIAKKVSKEMEFERRQAGEEFKLTTHNAKVPKRALLNHLNLKRSWEVCLSIDMLVDYIAAA